MRKLGRWQAVLAALVVASAAVLASCSSGGGQKVDLAVRLTDFDLTPSPTQFETGRLRVAVDNVGELPHSVHIVRARTSTDLPLRPDGSVDTDKIAAADKVAVIGPIAAQASVRRVVRFTPGTYVLFSNEVTTTVLRKQVVDFKVGMHEVVVAYPPNRS
jgi:hypothetical protein